MEIKRITQESELDALNLNTLLDPGTVWESNQGKAFLQNKDNILLVAILENQYVGFLTGHRLQRFDKRKAEVLLYEIGVHESFRRQGVGRALIESLKQWAKEVGADEVWVLTEKDNQAAMALYKSVGGEEDSPNTTMFTYKIVQD